MIMQKHLLISFPSLILYFLYLILQILWKLFAELNVNNI